LIIHDITIKDFVTSTPSFEVAIREKHDKRPTRPKGK